ncbi:MAG TPA: hypothetical protein VNA89_09700 [Gemmatimonadaceae bacterium]|nr:hypothetical protein [Gemmatimonadaceae bacterium]
MNHRHLHPDEIDLLVDGDLGFGVAPLKAHLLECADCRAQVEDARSFCDVLDHLPRFAPAPAFAEKVMGRVQVFVPWHVAALDSARRLVPTSRPARVLAGALAASVAAFMTLATVWIAARLDVVAFFSGLAVEQARVAVVTALSDAVAAAVGQSLATALFSSGTVGLAVAAALLLLTAAGAIAGVRALVGAAARRRS